MILNRQRGIRISVRGMNDFLVRAQRALRLPSDTLSICLVTPAQMARWNRAYRGKNGPTDVLSFPAHTPVKGQVGKSPRASKRKAAKDGFSSASYLSGQRKCGAKLRVKENGFSSTSYLGDIAIAPAVARENARRFGRTFHDELRILILHGILHVMGYDHETDTGQMERRELRLRRRLGLA